MNVERSTNHLSRALASQTVASTWRSGPCCDAFIAAHGMVSPFLIPGNCLTWELTNSTHIQTNDTSNRGRE
jgi:hypothetical protein